MNNNNTLATLVQYFQHSRDLTFFNGEEAPSANPYTPSIIEDNEGIRNRLIAMANGRNHNVRFIAKQIGVPYKYGLIDIEYSMIEDGDATPINEHEYSTIDYAKLTAMPRNIQFTLLERVQQPYYVDQWKQHWHKLANIAQGVTVDQREWSSPQYTRLDDFIKATGAKFNATKQAKSPMYNETIDEVFIPSKEQWDDIDIYFQSAFHELAHWTAHKTRMNRKLTRTRGKTYAKEELIAETTSLIVLDRLGELYGNTMRHSAAYCANWMQVLANVKDSDKYFCEEEERQEKDKAEEIMRAAYEVAEEAADYLFACAYANRKFYWEG